MGVAKIIFIRVWSEIQNSRAIEKNRSKNYFQDFRKKNLSKIFENFLNWPQITSQNQLQANNPNNNATSLSLFMTKTFFPKFSLFGHVDVDLFSVWINFPKSPNLKKCQNHHPWPKYRFKIMTLRTQSLIGSFRKNDDFIGWDESPISITLNFFRTKTFLPSLTLIIYFCIVNKYIDHPHWSSTDQSDDPFLLTNEIIASSLR